LVFRLPRTPPLQRQLFCCLTPCPTFVLILRRLSPAPRRFQVLEVVFCLVSLEELTLFLLRNLIHFPLCLKLLSPFVGTPQPPTIHTRDVQLLRFVRLVCLPPSLFPCGVSFYRERRSDFCPF
jgi:hypothetical protein